MEWIIAVGVALVVGLIAVLLGVFVFGPAERAAGAKSADEVQVARREGLQVGVEVVEKQEAVAEAAIRERVRAEKARDAVAVANELLKEKKP